MDIITVDKLALMAGVAANDNMRSIAVALNRYGQGIGLDLPHRLAHYLAQVLHESGNFHYDAEIASGRAYEGRKDLGNINPGDGVKFKGRAGIQITGRFNYRGFTDWCVKHIGKAPDFEVNPELVNTDPWEGLAPIWFWSTHKLNAYADENNIEQITKRINGGKNGLGDRIDKYVRVALVLNGYGPTDVLAFQTWAQQQGLLPEDVQGQPTQLDGDAGPKTRSAMHMALTKESPKALSPASTPAPEVKAGPVVVETETVTEVPVVAKGSTKRGINWLLGIPALLMTPVTWFLDLDRGSQILVGSVTGALIVLMLWRGELLVQRAKSLLAQIGGEE